MRKDKKVKKDSVSITACVGKEIFGMLDRYCIATGQSKTIAVERAIKAYCDGGKRNGNGDRGNGNG